MVAKANRKQYSRKLDLKHGKPIEQQFIGLLGTKKSKNKFGTDFGDIEIEYKSSLKKCLQKKFLCEGCGNYCLRISERKIELKNKGVRFFIQTDGEIFVIFHANDVFNSPINAVPNKYMPDGNELFFCIDLQNVVGRFDTRNPNDIVQAKKILGLNQDGSYNE